jgi:transposase
MNERISNISSYVGCNKSTISRLLPRIRENIEKLNNLNNMSDSDIASIIYCRPSKSAQLIDIEYIREQLKKPHVNRELLYSEFCDANGYDKVSRSAYYAYCKQNNVVDPKPSMKMARKPGETMEVDWAGKTYKFFEDGLAHLAHALVFSLPYSGMVYVEICKDEKMHSFIEGHINAFNFFQGVPKIIITDNLKVAVTKADKLAPIINEQYLDFCKHYGIKVSPARIASPRDKATVESMVKTIYTWIFGPLREIEIHSFEELKKKCAFNLDNMLKRVVRRRGKNRYELFELERPFLQKLPSVHYNYNEVRVIPNIDNSYHVVFDKHHYSVPYKYIGKSAIIKYNSTDIEIYVDGLKVADHKRSHSIDFKDRYVTIKQHKPLNHLYYERMQPHYLIAEASEISYKIGKAIDNILQTNDNSPEIAKNCRYILNYINKKNVLEIESVFDYIINNGISISFYRFKEILDNKLYK